MDQKNESVTAAVDLVPVDMALESLKLRKSILNLTVRSSLITQTLNQLPIWFEQLPLVDHALLLKLQQQLVERDLFSNLVPRKEKKISLFKSSKSNTSDSEKFERISGFNAVIKTLKQLKNSIIKSNSGGYQTILHWLEQLSNYYEGIYLEGSDQKSVKQYLRIQSSSLGYCDLSDSAAKRFESYFFSEAERQAQKKYRVNKYGLHEVIQMNQVHFKINPTAPGIEFAFSALAQLFTGQVSAPTELLVVEKSSVDENGNVVMAFLPALASQTISGIVFRDLFEQQPLAVKKIDPYSFSLQFILALLTRPFDAKTDNFIARAKYDKQGQLDNYVLVGIDNDESFAEPIFVTSATTKRHSLGMRSCLFCLPQMDHVIDKSVSKQLLEQNSIRLVLNWLKLLAQYSNSFEARGLATHYLKDLLAKVELPLRLVSKTAVRLYQTFCQIQLALRKNYQLTHKALLEICYPLVATYYEYVRKEAKEDLIQAMDLVYRGPFFEELPLNDSQMHDLKVFDQNSRIYKNQRQQTIIHAVQEFFEALDFSNMDVKTQEEILQQLITDFPSLRSITLNNCSALEGTLLQTMGKYLTHLEQLVLNTCEAFNTSAMHTLLQRFPNLAVTIRGLNPFKPYQLLTLFRFCSQLHFILQDGSKHLVDRKNQLLLPIALKQNDLHLVTFLLLAGFHLTGDFEKYFPLFEAIEQKQAVLVRELIYYGIDVNQYSMNLSPLDKAYQLLQSTENADTTIREELQKIIVDLIGSGAIESRFPEPILKISQVIWQQKANDRLLANKLIHFALAHNQLNELLVRELVDPDVIEIDWSSQFASGYQLTDAILGALLQRKKALRVLNLSGCKGVTKQHLKQCLNLVYNTLIIDFQQAIDTDVVADQSELSVKFKEKGIQIQIDSIQMNGSKIVQAQFPQMIQVLSQQKNQVKKLEITNSILSRAQIRQLADALPCQKMLQRVRWSGLGLGDKTLNAQTGFGYLMKGIKSPQLTELFLDNNDLNYEHAQQLLSWLQNCTNLKELSLYGNPLHDKGLTVLMTSLRNCQELTILNLNQIGLGDQGLMEWLQEGIPPRLVFLDIGYNNLTAESVSNVVELVQLNESVSEIRYEGQPLLEKAMPKNINELLQKNTRFEKHRQVLLSYQTDSQKIPVPKPIKPPKPANMLLSMNPKSLLEDISEVSVRTNTSNFGTLFTSSSPLAFASLTNPFAEGDVTPTPM